MISSDGARLKVLLFIDYFYPGFKSGGSLRTALNFIDHFGDEFDISVVTRDRDIGDGSCYLGIEPGVWCDVGKARVLYLSPYSITTLRLKEILRDVPHDVLYLNSFFSVPLSIKVLVSRFLIAEQHRKPILLAPRGEFSHAALAVRPLRKRLYIWLAKLFLARGNVFFQGSTCLEADDIRRVIGVADSRIKVAVDLPKKFVNFRQNNACREDDCLRLVFLSRIVPIKNLDFALECLNGVTRHVEFHIYGTVEDDAYWACCEAIMAGLPENISVRYMGAVEPSEVEAILSQYDVFFLPSKGENYGHVIAEALSVGTRVLISDRTPWLQLESDRVGWERALDDAAEFTRVIQAIDIWRGGHDERESVARAALVRLDVESVVQVNRLIFTSVAATASTCLS